MSGTTKSGKEKEAIVDRSVPGWRGGRGARGRRGSKERRPCNRGSTCCTHSGGNEPRASCIARRSWSTAEAATTAATGSPPARRLPVPFPASTKPPFFFFCNTTTNQSLSSEKENEKQKQKQNKLTMAPLFLIPSSLNGESRLTAT